MQRAAQSPGTEGQRPGRRTPDNYKWLVLITVVFGAFASILDTTIVNTALPGIQKVFGADLHTASYVATAYILAAGIAVPASAYLANRFGIKKIYLLSLGTFTIFSAACGLSPNIDALIVFRILQGAGGAALFPLSFAQLFAAFPENERGRANGFFGIPVLAAPALGPTLGGYLTEYADWRWIFYVNMPVGIIGVLMGIRFLREGPTRPELRLDLPGFLLVASGLGLLLYGLSNLAYDGWSSVSTVSGPTLVALGLLIAWVPVELRAAQPLLNLRLYTRWNFTMGALITLIGTVALFGAGFLLPQYLQLLRGETPFQSGTLLLWQGVGAVIGTVVSGQLYSRVGPRALVVAGALLLTATSFLLATWSTASSNLILLPLILLPRGVGLPFMLQSTNTIALRGIRGPLLPQATTLSVVARNVCGSLAIAVLTNYLDQHIRDHLAPLGRSAGAIAGGSRGSRSLAHAPRPVLDAIAAAYQDTYLLAALVIVPAIVVAFLLRPQAADRQPQDTDRPEGQQRAAG